ncbi:MAG: DUF2252 family protein [Acidobacteriota bacterium]
MPPKGPNSFDDATNQYRIWLGRKITITDDEWDKRTKRIAESSPFEYLRATFYRWSQWWPKVCEELNDAPLVLGIGDLHVENFGTWRDAEGRLVWGVNDFDECCCLPYTNDLVRLAASARLALEEPETKKVLKEAKEKGSSKQKSIKDLKDVTDSVDEKFRRACSAIDSGYRNALDPSRKDVVRRPFVLAEKEAYAWLREIVLNKLRMKEGGSEFDKFFHELTDLPKVSGQVPKSALEALNQSMPEPGVAFSIGTREAGLGSLGRQRFTAIVDDWRGGILAREAKALAPSAWLWWTDERRNTTEILYEEALRHAVRAPDPWVRIFAGQESWVVRRLAPDSGKVKLKDLPKESQLEDDLWLAMGHETANVHLALGNVWKDLEQSTNKDPDWLYVYATEMANKTMEDWATI